MTALDEITGMEIVVERMEQYRALLEARGFSRFTAEAMAIQYHHVICNEIDRNRADAHEDARRLVNPT